jgi:hypothetical protein
MWRFSMPKTVKLPEIDINDPEQLQQVYTSCYPVGSGPLGLMRIVTALIEEIAKEKGFELKR